MKSTAVIWLLLAESTSICTGTKPFKSDTENKPLFVTPFIEDGRLEEAKTLSRVGSLGDVEDVASYAGFLTVNKDMGSNMFFWLFPAKESPETAPVILWLQGGPGSSSMMGLFTESGPFVITDTGIPKLRESTWTRSFSVLYVDNPVGAGFSFTGKEQGYARNETDVGRNLLEALQQFFTLFHELAENEFYVAGESYAGKYVPAVAYAIHKAVQPRVRINLNGIAIGNGVVELESMLDYADYLYQLGLVDHNQAEIVRQWCDKARHYIEHKRYADAAKIFDHVILCGGNTTCYLKQVTGFNNIFNYLRAEWPKELGYYVDFLQTPKVRDAIHVGNISFSSRSLIVRAHLYEDIAKSVKPWLATLMEEYKVLIYNGQLDLIVPYPLTVNMISTIKWSGAEAFRNAQRKIWLSPNGQDVSGYVRQVGNFTEVLVRNAGHLVVHDQPDVTLDMITKFIRGQPFAPR
ncbi:venom serine carboxypeptidase [Ixodes scapularis]